MVSWHGYLFTKADTFWKNLRQFSFHNRTVLELFFILIYSLEQIILVLLSFKVEDKNKLTLLVSLFSIIVITTFSFHKLVMESRIKLLEKEITSVLDRKKILVSKMKLMDQKYRELMRNYQE